MSKSFDLVSRLARDECVRRLREEAVRAKLLSWWAVLSNKPVAGHVEDTSFRIRKRIAYTNPFQPHLSCELLDEGSRTRLRCRLGMHPAVISLTAIWFGGVLIAGGPLAIGAIDSLLTARPPADVWIGITAHAFMLAFGVAFVGLGHFAARDEQRFLVDFLRDTIAAREG